MDRKKILTICLILAGFFLYLVASLSTEAVFSGLDLPVTRNFFLSVPEWIGVAVAVLSLLIVWKNEQAMGFLDECTAELVKVVYPTPKESSQSGVVVVVMVGLATLFLAFFDYLWSALTQMMLRATGV